jgi:hypothetical protein
VRAADPPWIVILKSLGARANRRPRSVAQGSAARRGNNVRSFASGVRECRASSGQRLARRSGLQFGEQIRSWSFFSYASAMVA